MSSVRQRIETLVREVLDQPELELTPGLRAPDVAGWDSLAHVSLMFSIESEFGITFTDDEMGQLDDVDELIALVTSKATAN